MIRRCLFVNDECMHTFQKLFFVFFATSFFVYPVHAMIEPPFTEIQYCAQITNISKYPDFVFLSRPTLEIALEEEGGGYQELSDKTCFTRRSREHIFAIKKLDFKKPATYPWSLQNTYFKSLGLQLLDSQVEISVAPLKSYEKGETRKSIIDEYSIASLDATHLTLTLDKRSVTYSNGHVKELQHPPTDPLDTHENDPDIPAPKQESFFVSLWHWFISSIRSIAHIFQ